MIPTVPSALLGALARPALAALALARPGARAAPTAPFRVLRARGALAPGSMTLLLSPPGHGKTALLRALAGRLPAGAVADSAVRWGGRTRAELARARVNLALLATHVDQLDCHLPFLTVRETAAFAVENLTAAGSEPERSAGVHALAALSLVGCADTLVGDALTRGVSGGERRRVSILEALLSNARLLCLDEISTGLDASVTYDIVAAIRERTQLQRCTSVLALLQPTPEVYDLFDDVLLLRHGCTVYHGPRAALPAYVERLGFRPPRAGEGGASDRGNSGRDLADWLVDWLSDPAAEARLAGAPAALLPVTTAALVAAWEASEVHAQRSAERATHPPAPLELRSDFARAQFGQATPRPAWRHLGSLVRRQVRITLRNRLYIGTRLLSTSVLAAVTGSLWFRSPPARVLTKFGYLLLTCMLAAMGNQGEMPFAVANKFVAYKHMANGMFPPLAYALAHTAAHVPISLLESLTSSAISYWMVGLAHDGTRWIYFVFIVFLVNMAMGSMLRGFAFAAATLEEAQTAPSGLLAIQILFSGFMLSIKLMGWMTFLYYLSVFGYALHALALNEFRSVAYAVGTQPLDMAAAGALLTAAPPGTSAAQLCASGALACRTLGDVVLYQLGMSPQEAWRFGPVGFIAGVAVLANLLGGLVLSKPIQSNIGTARDGNDDAGVEAEAAVVAVAVRADDSASRALPFAPMTVVWRDLTYSVTLRDGSTKTLLRGITGVALPGRTVALMGASGAGKTTLLDVLAGRKNSGVATGNVFCGGFPMEPVSFARVTAYCEQQDVHSPLTTVGEAVAFAAALRLPSQTPAAARADFCAELEALLGLAPLRGRLVGMPGSVEGLAPGERKVRKVRGAVFCSTRAHQRPQVLTIAVELASNAPVLFLDEPTSGLDARAAGAVVRAVRDVAATQRCVVCTIHAPNAAIFGAFDDLLLLQRGGWQAYCGPVGRDGADVAAFLGGLPGARPLPPGMNAATWMLDVLSGNDSRGKAEKGAEALDGATLTAYLHASPQWAALLAAADAAAAPAPGAAPVRFASAFATPLSTQLAVVLRRQATSYMRDVAYNVTRITRLLGLQILFGTVYYKLQVVDAGGVSSLVAVIFLSTMFTGMLSVMVSMPVLLRARAVMYRERASRMYAPEVHAASFALIELPWTLLVVACVVPPVYFMVGLNPAPDVFFFYLFVVVVFAYMLTSLGHAVVAVVPTADTAVSLVSAVIPVFFLFGGLLISYADIPVYWQWMYRLDPLSYAVTALCGQQFMPRHACSGAYPAGDCPTVAVLGADGTQLVDLQAYVADKYGIRSEERWSYLGYMSCFAISSQIIHFVATRYITHMSR